jgi:hypothetical protein
MGAEDVVDHEDESARRKSMVSVAPMCIVQNCAIGDGL